MRLIFLFIVCTLPVALLSQKVDDSRWTFECGVSTCSSFKEAPILNLRYISPRFKFGTDEDEWSEEEEKHPEKFKKARLMFEILYAPPVKVVGTGLSVQYRIVKLKRLTLEAYCGLKIFFSTGPDFVMRPEYVPTTSTGAWYLNPGLICQLDLGRIDPFVDVGYDGIITVGAEVDFRSIYKKIKSRYLTPYLKQG